MRYAFPSSVKDLVEFYKQKELTVETVISIKGGKMEAPPGMKQATIGQVRAALMKAGYLIKVGTILDGKGKFSQSFIESPVDDIVHLTLAWEATESGTPAVMGVPQPEPEPEEVEVNIYELLDLLDYRERLATTMHLLSTLHALNEDVGTNLRLAQTEAERRERDIMELREELRQVKGQLLTTREELNRERSTIAPRVVERYVPVSTKPIPKGGEHGASMGKPGAIVVHRRGLMQHPPKAVRDKK